jgi:hypothetical protein
MIRASPETGDLNPTAPMSPIAEPVEMKPLKSVAGVRQVVTIRAKTLL